MVLKINADAEETAALDEEAPPTSRSPLSSAQVMCSQMTLRDYFAACALQGLLVERASDGNYARAYGDVLAQAAYAYADCMLKARNQ